jgi:hypothetical protein
MPPPRRACRFAARQSDRPIFDRAVKSAAPGGAAKLIKSAGEDERRALIARVAKDDRRAVRPAREIENRTVPGQAAAVGLEDLVIAAAGLLGQLDLDRLGLGRVQPEVGSALQRQMSASIGARPDGLRVFAPRRQAEDFRDHKTDRGDLKIVFDQRLAHEIARVRTRGFRLIGDRRATFVRQRKRFGLSQERMALDVPHDFEHMEPSGQSEFIVVAIHLVEVPFDLPGLVQRFRQAYSDHLADPQHTPGFHRREHPYVPPRQLNLRSPHLRRLRCLVCFHLYFPAITSTLSLPPCRPFPLLCRSRSLFLLFHFLFSFLFSFSVLILFSSFSFYLSLHFYFLYFFISFYFSFWFLLPIYPPSS